MVMTENFANQQMKEESGPQCLDYTRNEKEPSKFRLNKKKIRIYFYIFFKHNSTCSNRNGT